jgi:hypothetical protein
MRSGEIFARCAICGGLKLHSVALVGNCLYSYCHACETVHETGDAERVLMLLDDSAPPRRSEWQ